MAAAAVMTAAGIGRRGNDCECHHQKRQYPHKRAESGQGPAKHRLPQRELITPPHFKYENKKRAEAQAKS
jgi:hypothetical protein